MIVKIIIYSLSVIGLITILGVYLFYRWVKSDMKRSKDSPYPWGQDGNWYLGGKPKDQYDKLS